MLSFAITIALTSSLLKSINEIDHLLYESHITTIYNDDKIKWCDCRLIGISIGKMKYTHISKNQTVT